MKRSTIWDNKKFQIGACVFFWLTIWEVVSLFTPSVLFSSPTQTITAFFRIIQKQQFWLSIGNTLLLTMSGFLSAFILGSIFAVIAYKSKIVEILLAPAIQIMKSVPVTCFVIVSLIWLSSKHISILVAFFVVFPVSYISMSAGIDSINKQTVEMLNIFHVPIIKRVKMVYSYAVLPSVLAGCNVSISMSFKAAIAGEIIGLPMNTIGEQLYLSKLYLSIDELFAWTVVIIIISIVFEKVLSYYLRRIQQRLEKKDANLLEKSL